MKRFWCMCLFWVTFSSIGIYIVSVSRFSVTRERIVSKKLLYDSLEDFEGFDNNSGTPDGWKIVPNIVHFIRFEQQEFSFVDAVCVLAVAKNQKPDKIYIHTDVPNFYGKYWKVLLTSSSVKDVLELKFLRVPKHVFGQPLSRNWRKFHGGDVARLMVLMKYGGIYLDNDSYVVQSLDQFRKYEMTLGWKEGGNISNQVIVAHKNARFLRKWLATYKDNYNPKSWYYNAGIRPTREVLLKNPELVHRVARRLAEYHGIAKMLYMTKSDDWKDHIAIHLFINHQSTLLRKNLSSEATYPVVFNEENIEKYDVNFKYMAYDVYPFRGSNKTEQPVEQEKIPQQ